MTKTIKISLLMASILVLSACTSSAIPEPVRSPSFQSGSHDGCATATGEYTKNSASFNNIKDYKEGWFYGRKKCNPSQAQ